LLGKKKGGYMKCARRDQVMKRNWSGGNRGSLPRYQKKLYLGGGRGAKRGTGERKKVSRCRGKKRDWLKHGMWAPGTLNVCPIRN